jgi:N-hydroxyarylamine O-acetyltransferase
MRNLVRSRPSAHATLDGYFERIGYEGSTAPTLETLRALNERHTQRIAFENLDPFLGRPVRLDLESLERKLVHEGRGGYCFEHNVFFAHILRALGFQVTGLAARVLWNQADDAITARSHMLLRVEVAGASYIADTGFGSMTPTAPLLLQAGIEQATPHETFRLKAFGDEFLLQGQVDDRWKTLYRFGLQEQLPPDYEVANWYVSSHPQSRFVTGLSAARPAPGGRYTLRNTELAIHDTGGGTERRKLANTAALRAVLQDHFQLVLPEAPGMDARLEQLWAA